MFGGVLATPWLSWTAYLQIRSALQGCGRIISPLWIREAYHAARSRWSCCSIRPGHTRLPINDDEIIDRTLTIQRLAAGHVTLLTYDTGQSTRARAAGLRVNKLSKDIGDEPE
jgi:hypothetical protein